MKSTSRTLTIALLLGLVGCNETTFKEGRHFAGGRYASADTLNLGKTVYDEYCMACHGMNGDGKGVSAKGLLPPPRDFTLGLYKFGDVISGELPQDKDFHKIIKKGLHGTAMLPWDMSDGQIDAVVQYIKTFAPKVWEGQDKKLGEPIRPSKDPYGLAHRSAAIERGKEVYHVVAQCQSCHRAYASKSELTALFKKVNNENMTEFDPAIYDVKPQDSQYNVKNTPPDFTWHNVRSASTVEELYVRLVAGVGGTAMPSWKDTLKDEDIWAVAHYVHHLMSLKDTPAREALVGSLR